MACYLPRNLTCQVTQSRVEEEVQELSMVTASFRDWVTQTNPQLQNLENTNLALNIYISTVEELYKSDVAPRLADLGILNELLGDSLHKVVAEEVERITEARGSKG